VHVIGSTAAFHTAPAGSYGSTFREMMHGLRNISTVSPRLSSDQAILDELHKFVDTVLSTEQRDRVDVQQDEVNMIITQDALSRPTSQ